MACISSAYFIDKEKAKSRDFGRECHDITPASHDLGIFDLTETWLLLPLVRVRWDPPRTGTKLIEVSLLLRQVPYRLDSKLPATPAQTSNGVMILNVKVEPLRDVQFLFSDGT